MMRAKVVNIAASHFLDTRYLNMKGLLYFFLAGILVVGVAKDNTKDDMAAMQAKNVAIGASWRVKYDKPRCEITRHNGITLKVCG